MRVMLDTNVILDSMLQRPPWHADADAVLQAASNGQVTCAATALSLATAFYVGRRIVGTDQARIGIRTYLRAFEILPVDRPTLERADALPGNDLEDNIQIAAAEAATVDGIVTRNAGDFAHSPVSVWTPGELLQRLKAGGAPPAAVAPQP
ncbi:MAG: PIN domain-containing protein [Planctomycetes bacterium]|nr:PIN domain-containing protein [Planctomycetota bacterium]